MVEQQEADPAAGVEETVSLKATVGLDIEGYLRDPCDPLQNPSGSLRGMDVLREPLGEFGVVGNLLFGVSSFFLGFLTPFVGVPLVLAVLASTFWGVRLISAPVWETRPPSCAQSSSVLCGVFLAFKASSHLLATVGLPQNLRYPEKGTCQNCQNSHVSPSSPGVGVTALTVFRPRSA